MKRPYPSREEVGRRAVPGMTKICIHLTARQLAALRALAKKTGLSRAELVRRAVDEWVERRRGQP